MTDSTCAAVGKDTVKLEFVNANATDVISESRYALLKSIEEEPCNPLAVDVPGVFRLRVTRPPPNARRRSVKVKGLASNPTDPARQVSGIEVTWRSLWPGWDPAWDCLAAKEASEKLKPLNIYSHTIVLLKQPAGDSWVSPPLGLVSSPLDMKLKISKGFDEWNVKSDFTSGRGSDHRLLYAPPRGKVQFELRAGARVWRKSIPVWKELKLLPLEVMVCEGSGFDPSKDGDPCDRKLLRDLLDTCQATWARHGLEVSTWLPGVAGKFEVPAAGMSYHARKVSVPKQTMEELKVADDKQVPAVRSGDRPAKATGELISEFDRMVRYPRAYPPLRPTAIRVFIAQGRPYDRVEGRAISDYADMELQNKTARDDLVVDYQSVLDMKPARRTLFVYVNKGGIPGDPGASAYTVVAGGKSETYVCGVRTLAHEIGHIIMPKASRGGGGTHYVGSGLHLMSAGGKASVERGPISPQWIFDADYKWLGDIEKWKSS